MGERLSDHADTQLVLLKKEAMAGRPGRRRPALRTFFAAADALLLRLAKAVELRLAQEPPGLLPVRAGELAARVVQAFRAQSARHPALAELLRGRWRLVEWLAVGLAEALTVTAPRPTVPVVFTTPGTRLRWSTLAEWLGALRTLDRRPPSSAKNSAVRAHALALTQAVVNTGTHADLKALLGEWRVEVLPLWKEWVHLAVQGYSGRVRKLAQALKQAAAEHGVPNSWGCTELQAYGFPSPTAAGMLGRKKLHEVQELLGEGLRVDYDRDRCRFTLARG